ncbi:hypothetical protein RI367_008273 [Sorochytrium milnesiophthora]
MAALLLGILATEGYCDAGDRGVPVVGSVNDATCPTSSPSWATTHSSLSLTHVLYPTQSTTGKLMAHLTMMPLWIIAGETGVMAAATLVMALVPGVEATTGMSFFEPVWMLAGQLLNEMLNLVLKRTIQQDRPRAGEFGKGYGMPSSHAQFMFFVSGYVAVRVRGIRSHKWQLSRLAQRVVTQGVFVVAASVAYSRVYLEYHTAAQVLAGVAVGSVVGGCWSWIGWQKRCAERMQGNLATGVTGAFMKQVVAVAVAVAGKKTD